MSTTSRRAAMSAFILAMTAGGFTMAENSKVYPDKVIQAIHEALDDEYLAAAFYASVIEKFGEVRPFINIIEAERRHAYRLEVLLQAAGEATPENPYATGKKTPPAVPATLAEACRLGVDAEIANAALYDDKLIPAVKGYQEVEAAMRDLRAASQERHLPAFQRCIGRGGRGGGNRENR